MATSYFIYKASARWNEAILLLIRSKPHPDPIADWYFYSVLKSFPCSGSEPNLAGILIYKGMWLPEELMPS